MKSILPVIVTLLLIFQSSFGWAEKGNDCSCPEVTCGPCQKQVTIGKVVKFCDWGDINVCRKVVCENVNYYFGCLSRHNKNQTPKAEVEEQGELELVYDQEQKAKPETKTKSNAKSETKPQPKLEAKVESKSETPSQRLPEKLPPKKIEAKIDAPKTPSRSPASEQMTKARTEKVLLETAGRIEADNESRVIEGDSYSDLVVGEASAVDKKLEIVHRAQRSALTKGKKLFVGDEILNASGKTLNFKIAFEKGSVDLQIANKSKLIVQDPHSIMGRFQPFLYLVHGGVEYSVNMEEGSSFDLLAGQILTRTSSGKHSVKYEMDMEGLKVRVESFADSADVLRAQDLSGRSIKVNAGNFVSWVSETPAHLFSEDEKAALAGEGFITPVFVMSEERRQQLGLIPPPKKPLFSDWSEKPENQEKRDPASYAGDELCQAPSAGFQQCAWSCEGNSKSAKHCQADQDNVHCVRRVCNAAGQWGVPTAFASSYSDLCPAQGVRVGDCTP